MRSPHVVDDADDGGLGWIAGRLTRDDVRPSVSIVVTTPDNL